MEFLAIILMTTPNAGKERSLFPRELREIKTMMMPMIMHKRKRIVPKDRGNCFTGPTPRSPEINDYRYSGIDCGIKIFVGQFFYDLRHFVSDKNRYASIVI